MLSILVEFDSSIQVIGFPPSLLIHEQNHTAKSRMSSRTVQIILGVLVDIANVIWFTV